MYSVFGIGMSIKGFIFLFLILFLTFSPVTAGIDILHSYVEFPEFYEVNVSDNRAKIIGMVGVPYRGNVTLDSPYVVVDPTGAHLEMDIIYTNIKESDVLNISNYSTNKSIFWYESSNREGHFYQFFQLNDTFDLSEKFDEKIEKGENKSFEYFNIVFLEAGMYAVSWKLSGDERFKTMFVSIATPLEYEQLTKQAEVLEAEKTSAKESGETANATKILAGITFLALLSAFVIPSLEGKRRRKSLIKALYAEIVHNHSVVQKMINLGRTQTVFELTPLDTLSYQNMRMTGEVLALSEYIQRGIDELYVLINAHNRQLLAVYELISRELGFYERLEKISTMTENLIKEIPEIFNFVG